MFIGREKELALLQQDYIGKAAMVYGKRRVGKTTLIQKALKSSSYRTVYFECLKGTMQDNISGFVQELVRAKILPVPLNFGTLQDVFAYLNALPEKIVVVIDEFLIRDFTRKAKVYYLVSYVGIFCLSRVLL